MTMRLLLAALACAAAISAPAAAAPLEDKLPFDSTVCFERVYTSAHLAAHPKQKVQRIMLLQLGRSRSGDHHLNLMMTLRKRPSDDAGFDYRLSGLCKPKGAGLLCTNEWDAGSFTVTRAENGWLTVGNGGLTMNPYAWDSESIADDAVRVSPAPDDRSWKLPPAYKSVCKI